MLHLAHSPPFHTKLTASLCRATRRAACPAGVHAAVVAPPHSHQRRFLIRTFCASLSRPLYSQHQFQQLRQHPQPLSFFSTYARYRGLLTRCGKVPSVAIKPTTSSSSLSAPSALSESAPAVSVAPSSTRPPSVSGKPAGLASSTFTSVPATPSSPSPPPRPEMPNCEQSLANIVRSMSYHEKLKEDADREEDTGEEPVLLRGAPIADDMLRKIKEKVAILTETHRVTPSLVVVQVGDRADSSKYIRIKRVTAAEVGINFRLYKIDDTKDTQSLLLRLIQDLNEDDSVHGVVVQHPLPKHVDERVITNALSVGKDVDGFRYGNYTHPVVTDPNSPFKLFSHSEYFRHLFPNYSPVTSKDNEPPILGHYPCAPLAVVGLLFGYQVDIAGKNVLVIGASENVGTPISRMLAAEGANVVTVDALSSLDHIVDASLYSDIIVACCGVPRFVKRHWVRKGAAVVDVGINFIPYTYSDPVDSAPTDSTDDVVAEERAAMAALSAGAAPSTHVPTNATAIVDGRAKKKEGDTKAYLERSPEFQKLVDGDKVERTLGVKMVGDVDFDHVKKRAGFITPVPGGVGPLTVAFLLSNVLISAYDSARISRTFKAMSSATRAATIPSSSSDRSTA